MKFSEIPYKRPDVEHLKKELTALTETIASAATAEEQIAAFDRATALETDYVTLSSIAYVRNTINTADPFYDAEREYFDEIGPELSAVTNALEAALLDSPFRAALEAHYGKLLFQNMEISRRSFKPELIPLMQEAGKLEARYQKLYASMTVDFDGKTMPPAHAGKIQAERRPRRAPRRF